MGHAEGMRSLPQHASKHLLEEDEAKNFGYCSSVRARDPCRFDGQHIAACVMQDDLLKRTLPLLPDLGKTTEQGKLKSPIRVGQGSGVDILQSAQQTWLKLTKRCAQDCGRRFR